MKKGMLRYLVTIISIAGIFYINAYAEREHSKKVAQTAVSQSAQNMQLKENSS